MFGRRTSAVPYGDSSLALTSLEQSASVHMLPSISTLNVYSGPSPLTVQQLRARVAAVLTANPWLTGRLVSIKSGCELRYHRQPTEADCSAHLGERAVTKLPIDPCTVEGRAEYSAVVDSVGPLLIPPGGKCLDKLDQLLFRVVMLTETSGSGRSGLLVTMSHVLADGYTYYAILQQLDSSQPVVAMDAGRSEELLTAMDDVFKARYMRSAPIVFGLLCGILRNAIVSLHKPSHTWRFSSINDDAVQRAKQEGMARVTSSSSTAATPVDPSSSVPYLSTHDVVASRFLSIASQAVNCVAFNCRARVPRITSSMAGNFEAVVIYPLADVQRPEQIRRSVVTLSCDSGKLPAKLSALSGFGIISDWSSLYRPVQLDGFTLLAHMPIFTPFPFNVGAACVLFRLHERQRAVMTNMPTALDGKWRREAGIITMSE